jgi:hypothetical protein
MKTGQRGPAWQKKERVAYILSQSRKFVPVAEIRRECMEKWDISSVTWSKYWKAVGKYLERVTLRQAKDYKGIILGQLEALIPECTKVTGEGDIQRDVMQTRAVLKDIRELLGTDAPAKSQIEQSTDMTLLTALGINQVPPGGSQPRPELNHAVRHEELSSE